MADCHASLDQRLGMAETRAGELQPCVQALWSAAVASCSSSRRADEEVRLTREEVEELVLAYLVAYPDVLAPSLLKKLVQQLALGQSLWRCLGQAQLGTRIAELGFGQTPVQSVPFDAAELEVARLGRSIAYVGRTRHNFGRRRCILAHSGADWRGSGRIRRTRP